MERDITRLGVSSLQSHSQVESNASASSDRSLAKGPDTITNNDSINNPLAPVNGPHGIEMDVLGGAHQHYPTEHSTELK